jgi:hypothetical protein
MRSKSNGNDFNSHIMNRNQTRGLVLRSRAKEKGGANDIDIDAIDRNEGFKRGQTAKKDTIKRRIGNREGYGLVA